jgi:hypothetical protein
MGGLILDASHSTRSPTQDVLRQPLPVVVRILEALRLYCQVLRLLPCETTVILSDGSPLLEGIDVRD